MHWTFRTMYIMEETNRKSKELFIKDLQILKTPLGAPVPKVKYLLLKFFVDYCLRRLTFLLRPCVLLSMPPGWSDKH